MVVTRVIKPLETIPVTAAKPTDPVLEERRQHPREGLVEKIADATYDVLRHTETPVSMAKPSSANVETPMVESTIVVGEQTLAVDKEKSTETGYCGFTFSDILSNHCCNDCGKAAEGMLKKWDAGVLVWARYCCARCSNKHIQKYTEQIIS